MNRLPITAQRFLPTYVRKLSTSERVGLEKVKKTQKFFQEDNDIPVYLKGGNKDYVMFYTTVGLAVVGLGMSFQALYKLANKK